MGCSRTQHCSGTTATTSITFDDHLDTQADGATSSYAFNNFSFAKGGAITYSAFESQTLLSANGVVAGQFNTVPVVSLNAVSSQIDSTTIVGGVNRGCTVNVGNGDLNNVAGSLDFPKLPGQSQRSKSHDRAQLQLRRKSDDRADTDDLRRQSLRHHQRRHGQRLVHHHQLRRRPPIYRQRQRWQRHVTTSAEAISPICQQTSQPTAVRAQMLFDFWTVLSTSHDSLTLTTTALLIGGTTLSYATMDQVVITVGSGDRPSHSTLWLYR
jgi:hypothetical protein